MSKPYRLPSGHWRIRWFDEFGNRKSEAFASEAAAKAALRHRQVGVDNVRAGVSRARSEQTLRDASQDWIESRKPSPDAAPDVKRRRNKRVRNNQQHLDDHILPELGDLRLPEINTAVVQKFIQHLEGKRTARNGEKNNGEVVRTLKAPTINNVLITLRKLMNDLGYPMRIRYSVPESAYGWIKRPADVARFLGQCKTPWFRMASELAVYAGLRQGEVVGLMWNRIDFDRALIQVDRSYDGPCKNKHLRAVPLSPELAEKLKRWRLHTGAASNGLVVTMEDENGKRVPIGERTDMGKRTRRVCKRAGVEPVTFHQLRHTFASHLAERVSLPIVGAVLGHADPKTTARYAHVDTASLARDPRLHLSFSAQAGEVAQLSGHAVATTDSVASAAHAK